MAKDFKFLLNKGDLGVNVYSVQFIAIVDSRRFKGSVHLMVLLAILALTRMGNRFVFVGTHVLRGGMKGKLDSFSF